ncbi:double-strand break repair protein AddB [Kaistia dalseonensis]|uniref:ATP-dependent helicase/nuclease subunit B n=1 Tax=Kaistia dalseonensis TaxID=410840 RepID=A0ABU0H5C4_9HYPH|nr:double-strand break repair protein AddB [Kaistia dalseonensis]MCX5494931.1 double-strand break repair protein AddB [Kaistia dalseonensis]MDQ0437512.1 ATP-dependent helicase/nuclease subunit B [Kaistia dalseonensis]
MDRGTPRVFSILPGAPFLPTLVDALFTGRFGALADPAEDPLALAEVTIFLPTRRAARVLHAAILERVGGRAVILPSIRPIGDVDEEDLLLEPAEDPAARLVLPPAISQLDRLLVLTRLTLAWGRAVKRDLLALAPDDPLLVPASAADAFHLAGDLARLIDDIETSGVAWDRLATLVPDDLARYWQITLDFLKIVGEQWPAFLAESGLADPAVRRDYLIRQEAARLAAAPPTGLVIAAGSTGSIPATAALLATIARLPNGAVVLPGLDTMLDDVAWGAIGGPDQPKSAPGHPQYGLRQLIATIGVDRADVEPLGVVPPAGAQRARLISEALRPAETTEDWASAPPVPPSASDGVGLIIARTEQEEAVAIALALREAVETEGSTAALITPDRRLAGRVAIELARFGLSSDDSAGRPLMTSPAGVLARLVVAAARSNGAPLDLMALAKHPLARFGRPRALCRRAIEILDLAVFRGRLLSGGLQALPAAVLAAKKDAIDPTRRHVAPAVRALSEADWQAAQDLAAAMDEALSPLTTLMAQRTPVDAATAIRTLVTALERVSADENGLDDPLWEAEAGDALATLLAGLIGDHAAALAMTGAEFPAFFDATMAGISVSARPGGDPRLFIWGTLEARLQSVDLVVLAGLDEGIWPAETRTDPWLSRSMRTDLGLEAPERRLGLSAHDFAAAFVAPKVLLTRAERRGGTPTVAARWLQRLLARLGKPGAKALVGRGSCYVDWARSLDRLATVTPIGRPRPQPPLDARPKRLSVTEIETLIRDPYAIYARHVLRLQPLDPVDIVPDVALRGTLIHDALGQFIETWQGPFDANALEALMAVGRTVFAQVEPFLSVHALWWPRFVAIAQWFIGWEASRHDIAARHAEIGGSWPVNERFRLTGRADRIDQRRDGTLEILDFKTGVPPSAKQLSTGLAPQLALEVAMARAGAFEGIPAGASVAELGWIGLGRVGKGEPFASAIRDLPADALGQEAAERLVALITAYADPDRAYISRARPMFETRFESPYDHLARVREWALGVGEDGE